VKRTSVEGPSGGGESYRGKGRKAKGGGNGEKCEKKRILNQEGGREKEGRIQPMGKKRVCMSENTNSYIES